MQLNQYILYLVYVTKEKIIMTLLLSAFMPFIVVTSHIDAGVSVHCATRSTTL